MAATPTRGEVEGVLGRVLASGHVPPDSQLAAFLRYVVRRTLDGEASEIKAYSIAVDALGKPEEFDPQSNATVRVMAGRLRKALALHDAEEHAPGAVRIRLPTGTYVPIFERAAEAKTVIGAGAQPEPIEPQVDAAALPPEATAPEPPAEPTPGPPTAEHRPPPLRASRRAARRRLVPRDGIDRSRVRVAAVLLAAIAFIGVGALLAGQLMAEWRREQALEQLADLQRLPSIAVSVTTGDRPLPAWFSRSEFLRALDTVVGRFDDYTHYGTFALDGLSPPVLARTLPDADYHLSLAPMADGGAVRLYGSVTRVKDRVTVWSGALRMAPPAPLVTPATSGATPPPTPMLDRVGRVVSPLLAPYGALYSDLLQRNDTRPALRCLLLGYRYFNAESDALHARARNCAENLIERGSRLPSLHAMLTFLYLDEHREGRNARRRDPVRAARTVARQAIEYGAQSARAHQALFAVRKVSRQFHAARRSGRRAVALNPFDTDIVGDYAAFLAASGEVGEARALMREIEPLWVAKPPWYAFHEFLAAELAGERDEAVRLAQRLDPRASPLAAMGAAIGAQRRGDRDEVSFALEELLAQEPRFADDPVTYLRARGMRGDVAASVARKLWAAGLDSPGRARVGLGVLDAPLW